MILLKEKRILFFTFLLLFSHLQVTSPFFQDDYLIKDLQDSTFTTDVNAWGVSPGWRTGDKWTDCGGILLLGGHCMLGTIYSQSGGYFERTYSSLPAHNALRISFTFWAIDSWDSNDSFQLYFDGTIYGGWYLYLGQFLQNFCGHGNWNERGFTILIILAHTQPTVTMRVISYLDEESCNEALGIRDLQIVFDRNVPPTSFTMCGVDNSGFPPTNNCGCPVGTYNPSCLPCNSLCKSCWGGGANQCYSCIDAPDVTYDGTQCIRCTSPCGTCSGSPTNCVTCVNNWWLVPWTKQCVRRCPWPLVTCYTGTLNNIPSCCSPNAGCTQDKYFYWDGVTCLDDCPAPYQAMTELILIKLCLFQCSPVEYLYWDGSCGQDCGTPLTIVDTGIDGRKLCTWGCPNKYQYLYWDGSCQTSCAAPRITLLQNGRYICAPPCLTYQYVHWTGECTNSCPHGWTTTGGISYCTYPCSISQFYYWDGNCYNDCPYPLKTRVSHFRQYCDYPGYPTSTYLYWDGSASSTCPSPPLTSSNVLSGIYSQLLCRYGCEWGFTYWDNTCLDGCAYPLTVDIVNNRQHCRFPCTTTTDYLYWNGTCQSSCDPPLTQRTPFKGRNFCDYSCLTGQYLHWDGLCSWKCDGILVKRIEGFPMVRNFCDFPCSGNKYYYTNGSCIDICPPPLVSATDRTKLYCSFPCADGQFLYYNGTCTYTCDHSFSQLIVSAMEKYCVQSPLYTGIICTEFYYWNNTCHSTCPAPLAQALVDDQKWCLYPCLVNQFLYANGTCLDTCEDPFTERYELGYKYCDYSCGANLYFYWNGSCLPECPLPLRHEINLYGVSCLFPCNSSAKYYDINTEKCVEDCASPSLAADDLYPVCLPFVDPKLYGGFLDLILKAPTEDDVTLVTLSNIILGHVRYLDMPFPPRLQNLVSSKGRNIMSLGFGQKMPYSLETTFMKRPLPKVFEQRGLHSSFIVNFWSQIMSWLIVVTALFILIIFEKAFAFLGWASAKAYFKTLKLIIKWNLCLILVAISVGDIAFFSLIEWISLDPHLSTSFSSILLLFTLLFMMIIFIGAILYLVQYFDIVKRKVVLYNDTSDYIRFLMKWKEFQILFRGFRGHSNLNQYFILLYMFRITFPMIFAVFLRSSPLAQTILQVIFSSVVMSYILTAVPVVRKINFLQLFIIESLALIVNISLLLICILNMVDAKHSKEYNMLGDIVVGGNSTINLMAIVFLIVKFCQGIWALDRYTRIRPEYPGTIWLQLLVYICQQCGMGFEEMFVDPEVANIFNMPYYLVNDRSQYEKDSVKNRAHGAFSNVHIKPEQNSTLVSFFNQSKDSILNLEKEVQIKPKPIDNYTLDKQVGSISDLASSRAKTESRPFYWLQNIASTGGPKGPKNAQKPQLELVQPKVHQDSQNQGQRDRSGDRSRKSRSPQRQRSEDERVIRDLRSNDPMKKKSPKRRKKQRPPKPNIVHL